MPVNYIAVPKVNPNNMTWTYNVAEDGAHFININRWYGEQKPLYNNPIKDDGDN